MAFGFGQLKNTTPQRIKDIRDAIIYFFIGCLAFANLFAPKLNLTGEDYAMWIGFIMLVVKFVAKLFGVGEDEAVKNVVQAVKEAKEKTDE